MFHALYTAASGMTAQQINLDNIANNLANSSTAGFQSRRVQFSDLLYQNDIMPALRQRSRPRLPPACRSDSERGRETQRLSRRRAI